LGCVGMREVSISSPGRTKTESAAIAPAQWGVRLCRCRDDGGLRAPRVVVVGCPLFLSLISLVSRWGELLLSYQTHGATLASGRRSWEGGRGAPGALLGSCLHEIFGHRGTPPRSKVARRRRQLQRTGKKKKVTTTRLRTSSTNNSLQPTRYQKRQTPTLGTRHRNN
jgi:hypothetical protein